MGDGFIEQLTVFQGFSQEQFGKLRPLFTLFFMPVNTTLFEQGDPAECIYLLAEGEVAIRYKPDDGPPLTIARVRAEGVIGWSAAIGNPEYTSSVICTTDCKILRMRSAALRELYDVDPVTGALILEKLAAMIEVRLRSNHPQLMALLEQSLSIKLDHPVQAG